MLTPNMQIMKSLHVVKHDMYLTKQNAAPPRRWPQARPQPPARRRPPARPDTRTRAHKNTRTQKHKNTHKYKHTHAHACVRASKPGCMGVQVSLPVSADKNTPLEKKTRWNKGSRSTKLEYCRAVRISLFFPVDFAGKIGLSGRILSLELALRAPDQGPKSSLCRRIARPRLA